MLDGESYRQSPNTRDREVAQISVLNGLGWELHRIWTMDWWDNRDKELSKLMRLLDEKKEAAHRIYQERQADGPVETAKAAETTEEPAEPIRDAAVEKVKSEAETDTEESVGEKTVDEVIPEQKPAVAAGGYFAVQKSVTAAVDAKVASGKHEIAGSRAQADPVKLEYRVEDYISADAEVTALSASDYVKKENLALIADKMQQIVDAEAPITYDRLIKKTLRAFHIARSSAQTLEAADKALKKVSARMNKQAGVKFYWRKDQDPDQYRIYRNDANSEDRRPVDDICQQELKNAVCVTLAEKGAQDKDSLMRSVIRTMGYARSSIALTAAAERGLKYGRKTGEIAQDEEKRFVLGD